LAGGGDNGGEAVAAPALGLIDAPVGTDEVMIELGDAGWELVPEPVGGVFFIDPGDGVEEGPEFFGFVLLEDGVDVEADGEADFAVFGVVGLDAAVAGSGPGFFGVGPGVELAVVGDEFSIGACEADGVEIAGFLAWRCF